jgi:hypothetical protein
MQEPAFGNPAFLLDQNAVHDRDLAGRPAETEHGNPQPHPERLAQRDSMIPWRRQSIRNR